MNIKDFEQKIGAVVEIYNQEFNVFKVLKEEEHETKHSNFLSWLFNPRAAHGLKGEFVERFLKKCIGKEWKDEYKSIQNVLTEVRIDGEEQRRIGKDKRRIDILIIGNNFTCTIENKYGSEAHGGQCSDYRSYIKSTYANKENFFVFLDINKPSDFEDNHKERYAEFTFISYKDILDILDEIVKDDKKASLEKQIVLHYKQILRDKYSRELDKRYIDICNVLSKEELDFIINLDESFLTESEKVFVGIVKDYYTYYKNLNNERIREVLTEITKERIKLKDDYGTGKKKRNSQTTQYAYAIEVPEKLFGKKPFINTVDYTALGDLRICIYAGLIIRYSKNLERYIRDNHDVWDKIIDLATKGWNCVLEYRVGDASGYTNKEGHIWGRVVYDINGNSSTSDIKKFIEMINANDDIGKKEKKYSIACIRKLRECKGVDAIVADELIRSINDKNQDKACSVLALSLTYPLEKEGEREDDWRKDNMRNIYREKTIEGLNAFNLGERFALEILK